MYRFPGSIIQFLWSLSEYYLNYGNKTLINGWHGCRIIRKWIFERQSMRTGFSWLRIGPNVGVCIPAPNTHNSDYSKRDHIIKGRIDNKT
jgi:hypothetical protein